MRCRSRHESLPHNRTVSSFKDLATDKNKKNATKKREPKKKGFPGGNKCIMFRSPPPPPTVRRQREILRRFLSSSSSSRRSSHQCRSYSYSSSSNPNPNSRDGFSTGFQRYFGFGLSALTLYAFNLAIDDLLLYEKAKSVAMPKLEKSQRVLNVVALNRNDDDGVRLETDFWYNASCNKRGENVRVVAFIADGKKASCDVKVVMMRKFEHKGIASNSTEKKIKKIKKEGETDDSTSDENEDKDDAARAKPYQSAWLRSPLKYLPESVKNAMAMDQIWEIVEVSATLPNEQGMGVPGQVDLLKKEKQWKHTSKKKKR